MDWKMTRRDRALSFDCVRCKEQGKPSGKKAKNVAVNSKGQTICNGCYGWIMAKDREYQPEIVA